MSRFTGFVCAFVFFVLNSAVWAGDIPDLTGTWAGPSQVHSANHDYVQGNQTTLVIEEQKGNLFQGVKTYFNAIKKQSFSEPFSGSVTPDGHILIAEHADGYMQGRLMEDGTLILQYAECGSTSSEPKAPFFKKKKKKMGTGLGLSITYGLVKKLHGNIRVESSEGIGTIFTVTLPVKIQKKDKEEA